MALSTHDELLMLRKRARRRLVGAIVMVSVSTAVLWNVVDRLPEQAMRPEAVDITGLQAASAAVVQAPVASVAAAEQPATELLAALPPEETLPASAPKAAEVASKPAALPPVAVVTKPADVASKKVEPAKAPPSKAETVKVEPVKKAEAPKAADSKPTTRPDKAVAASPEKPQAKEPAKPDPMAILEGRDAEHPKAPVPDKKKNDAANPGSKFSIQLAALSDQTKVDALKSRLSGAGVNARFSKVQTSKGEVTRVRVGPFASREEADAALRRLAKAGVTGIVVAN